MKLWLVSALCVLLASPALAQQVGDTVIVVAAKSAALRSKNEVVTTVPRGSRLRVHEVTCPPEPTPRALRESSEIPGGTISKLGSRSGAPEIAARGREQSLHPR